MDGGWEEEARALDESWASITCACRRVRDILDLKTCVAGVATSMHDGNYEEAARCIQRFRVVDDGTAAGTLPGVSEVGSVERAFMARMYRELKHTVVEKFDAAVASP